MTHQLTLDISGNDGVWVAQLAASKGVKKATIRATWGTLGVDCRYTENDKNALACSFELVHYHWYMPRRDPATQAKHFAQFVIEPGDLMVDLEDYKGVNGYIGMGPELKSFTDNLSLYTHRTIIFYASPFYIKSYLAAVRWLNDYGLVVANWDVAHPYAPLPWYPDTQVGWQFTAKAYAPDFGLAQCRQCSLYWWYAE
jgi:GH25 family lysozyme M1 (1,4-beta-N-acetylmuramidase)